MPISSSTLRYPFAGIAAFAGAIVLTTWSMQAVAQATVYRCTNSAGVVEYGNAKPSADQQCEQIALPAITTVKAGSSAQIKSSAPKSPAAAGKAESEDAAKNFPKVGSGTQSRRDDDRSRILKDELTREEKKLASLRQEYKNGQPDRRGDERNYQRYLDRVEAMKANISRAEGNVESLQRELAAVKN